MRHYFSRFPTVEYNGVAAVDILRRVAVRDDTYSDPYAYYPYPLLSDERPDQLAHRYYGDAYADWILYHANRVVDPYYGWKLTDAVFNDFVAAKYGSVELAQSRTKYYQNAWFAGDTLPRSAYDALPPSLHRYWAVGPTGDYVRRRVDYTVSTNAVVAYALVDPGFETDEVVEVSFDGSTVSATAQVVHSTTTELFAQHVVGTAVPDGHSIVVGPSSVVRGRTSGLSAPFTAARTVAVNLLPEEAVYWAPVTYWDYEAAKNAFNSTILVLNSDYYTQVNAELTKDLKQ